MIGHVIIIVDDIMIVGYRPDHSDHDQAFTILLQTAQKCNVNSNMTSFNTSKMKLNSLVKLIPQAVTSQVKIRYQLSQQCLHRPVRSKYSLLLV